MNNNIQESYCSLEVSKLLKKKGFDIRTPKFFYTNGVESITGGVESIGDNYWKPTHALAIEWIRVNFDISIDVASYYNPWKIDKRFYEWGLSHKDNAFEGLSTNAGKRINVDWLSNPNKWWLCDTPQEATEAALKYVLSNLI